MLPPHRMTSFTANNSTTSLSYKMDSTSSQDIQTCSDQESSLTPSLSERSLNANAVDYTKSHTNIHFRSAGVNACTTLVPSLNLVRKIRFAFWNIPSFRLTTMNWLPLNLVLIRRPIFCVCDRSRAASTSSRMYMGAGLNCRSAMMRERAMSDL